jgi:hypothetical protein
MTELVPILYESNEPFVLYRTSACHTLFAIQKDSNECFR